MDYGRPAHAPLPHLPWIPLALFVLVAPLVVHAQQPSTVPRIAFLGGSTLAESGRRLEAFRQALRDLGYAEGRTIAIEYRWTEGRLERVTDFVGDLAALKVEVIVASSTPLALAARNVTRTIPIVFVTAADPVGSGLVASVARPGGNVTGLSLLAPELVARQLQLLKEAVPKASRVAVLANPANAYTPLLVKEAESAARSLGVKVHVVNARTGDALDGAFAAITRERPGALFVLFDPVFVGQRTRITEFAGAGQLPAMYPHREYAEAGGLMAYGADLGENFRRAAVYVDKILKGAKPADLPVEQPRKFELVINLKTAKALRVTIPDSLLLRADDLIK